MNNKNIQDIMKQISEQEQSNQVILNDWELEQIRLDLKYGSLDKE